MNWDIVEGNWTQFKADMRQKWGKLTDNDWEQIGGKKDKFFGVLQERYGYQKEDASKEVNSALEKWKPTSQRH